MKLDYLIISFVFFGICGASAFGQNYAVSISDSEQEPDSLSILDVSSTDKGVLIPRMTTAERDNIENPADGLLVYVTDLGEHFWYWDNVERIWVRLMGENSNSQSEPLGTIIMFTGVMSDFYTEADASGNNFQAGLGKPGTEVQGWAICNGNNGSPNLERRYLVGSGKEPGQSSDFEYTLGQESSIASRESHTMTQNEMSPHRHDIKDGEIQMAHTHKVVIEDHTHKAQYRTKSAWFKKSRYLVRSGDNDGAPFAEFLFNEGNPVDTREFEIQDHSAPIPVEFPDDLILDGGGKTDGTQTPMVNQPESYAVVYLIRVGNGVYSSGQFID